MKRALKLAALVGVTLGIAALLTKPPELRYAPTQLSDREFQSLIDDDSSNIVPGTEKRLTWVTESQSTEYAVVALHGFSASRQETAPLAELVAKSLNANLFETRFSGHGLIENRLTDVRAESWLDDTAEALEVGRRIGNKTVVIGVSTGATLALAMLDQHVFHSVDTLVLISPNIAPADPNARMITGPAGPVLLRLISGDTRSWEAHNESQERFWTTSYPTRTLVEVMRVVDLAEKNVALHPAPPVQIFYSPDDTVISVAALLSAYESLDSKHKAIHIVPDPGAPSAHMIVGDIISPNNTAPVAEKIADFILRRSP